MKKLKKIICVNMFFKVIIALIALFVFGCKENKNRIEENKNYELIKNAEYLEDLFEETSISIEDAPKVKLFNICKFDGENIYLANIHDIFKFDLNGKMVGQLSNIGRGPGEYPSFSTFDVDNKGNVILVSPEKIKILIYDKNLSFLREFKIYTKNIVTKILTNDGRIYCYIPLNKENPIYEFDYNGKLIKKFGIPDELALKYDRYATTGSIGIDDGALYQINSHKYEIYKFNLEGDYLETIIPSERSEFKVIDKVRRGAFVKDQPVYSIVFDFFVGNGLIFVHNLNPNRNTGPKELFDILDEEGTVLKKDIELRYKKTGYSTMYKFDKSNFITFKYPAYRKNPDLTLGVAMLEPKF